MNKTQRHLSFLTLGNISLPAYREQLRVDQQTTTASELEVLTLIPATALARAVTVWLIPQTKLYFISFFLLIQNTKKKCESLIFHQYCNISCGRKKNDN